MANAVFVLLCIFLHCCSLHGFDVILSIVRKVFNGTGRAIFFFGCCVAWHVFFGGVSLHSLVVVVPPLLLLLLLVLLLLHTAAAGTAAGRLHGIVARGC